MNFVSANRTVTVAVCLLACPSCVWRSRVFRVVPATPAYLLRSPDAHETPFPEILRDYNGFVPGREGMDLHPGMELRIENAYYQPGASRRGLNGYLGTEIARYQVQSSGGLQMLSVESMKGRPSEQLPVQQLIRASELRDRVYRFYYEILFRGGNARGSVLLGASAKDEMGRLASQLLIDPDSVCGKDSQNCTVFPEACSVSIEMEIVVNGARRSVVWGSLLSSVVEHPNHVEVSRLYNGRLAPVKLDLRDAKALELPLLPGDRVTWS